MTRKRRLLGKEIITFIDGETQEVELFAISDFEMGQLRRLNRKTKLDKKGNIDNVEFIDEEFRVSVFNSCAGNQVSREDWKQTETSLTELYRKYFEKDTPEKKSKSSDTSTQDQDKNLEE